MGRNEKKDDKKEVESTSVFQLEEQMHDQIKKSQDLKTQAPELNPYPFTVKGPGNIVVF